MLEGRQFPSAHRFPLLWYLALSILVVQGLKVHYHSFAGHEPLHGHGHAVELHVGGAPIDSGHDNDTVGEAGFAKYAVLKVKSALDDGLTVAIAATLILFVLTLTGRAPWRPWHFFPPASGNDVRTPPQRAPPF